MIFKEIAPNIYAVEAKTQKELAQTFLRFQEHYESPHFKGKIFTLKEFVVWYKKFTKKQKFTYYQDWVGFNIPDYIFKNFFNGSFNPLTKKEQWLLNKVSKIKPMGNPYYIVGYVKGSRTTQKHEMAHALFYTNFDYKRLVLNELIKFDHIFPRALIKIEEHLKNIGYHESTVTDEIHAYILCEKTYLKDHNLWIEKLDILKYNINMIYKALK